MKKTSLFGVFCVSAILGIALCGNQTAQSAEALAQPDDASSNRVPVSGINASPGNTLPADIDPNSAVAELVNLVQAGVEESVILAYIEKNLRLFNLDADDIIYLTDIGTPAEIIKAAMEHDERLIQKGISPEAVAVETAPLEEVGVDIEEQSLEVADDYFYDRLAPYGVWVHIDGYGRCWRPTVAVYNTGWQPYCDNGHWVYTIHGWYWASGYSWGSSTFHYGRWFRHSRHGWCWWPDTIWAPSWVCWRYDRSYCGWAPLPPHTVYRPGIGFVYRGSTVVAGFDFGLSAGAFTFVATRNFCDPKPWHHRIGTGEAARIYSRTTVFHKINYDQQHRRISNAGISHRDISVATRQEIHPVSIRQANGRIVRSSKQERFDRDERTPTMNRMSQKTTPPTIRPGVQRPEHNSGASKSRNGGQNNSRESTPQSPQALRKQTPHAAPRQQERNNAAPPQKNDSNRPAQRQAQNNRAKPTPKVKQSHKAKTPSPSTSPKAKGNVRNENTGQ